MTVLEPGPGMGFFTIPPARLVGASGRVVAVDLQRKMIAGLKLRAAKAGALVLLAEPRGHVKHDTFEAELAAAAASQFAVTARPVIRRSHAVVLEKR